MLKKSKTYQAESLSALDGLRQEGCCAQVERSSSGAVQDEQCTDDIEIRPLQITESSCGGSA